MRYRPIDRDPVDTRLGRYIPDDRRHLDSYPLTALAVEERPTHVPVVMGVNWYSEMDHPVQDLSGDYFIARGGAASLTAIRGGHCVCLEPGDSPDRADWQKFYQQSREGACVGFAWSRCISILNGELFAAQWLWDRAKERDEWPQTNPGDNDGTSVRAAAEVLTMLGHVTWREPYANDDTTRRAGYRPSIRQGIAAFRWAQSVDEVHAVLGNIRADQLGAVPILNSWGADYPYRVWLPDDVIDRLLHEDGELAIPTDR